MAANKVSVSFYFKGNVVSLQCDSLEDFRDLQRTLLHPYENLNANDLSEIKARLTILNDQLQVYADNHHGYFNGIQNAILEESWGATYKICTTEWVKGILLLIYYNQIDNSTETLNGYTYHFTENLSDGNLRFTYVAYEDLPAEVLPMIDNP
jgi:hypothetical protein